MYTLEQINMHYIASEDIVLFPDLVRGTLLPSYGFFSRGK